MAPVIFRNRKRADIDHAAYEADAAHMALVAQAQPGYIWFKSDVAGDGEVIALSQWADRDAALAWRRQADHAAVKQRGRDAYYESYTLFGCDNPNISALGQKDDR